MSKTRLKMECGSKQISNEGTEQAYANIIMYPVIDGSEENKKFWEYTPVADFNFGTSNLAAVEQFEVGKEYYVDIILAEGE
jgi:hypothetical protein